MAALSWGLFPVYIVTGACFGKGRQELVVYASWILLLFPAALTVAFLARGPLAQGDASVEHSPRQRCEG